MADSSGRPDVVLGLSNSTEFTRASATAVSASVNAGDAAPFADDVYRLYLATLEREPDDAGLAGWAEALARGTPLNTVISGFIASPEFNLRYGALDDADFVTLLYRNVLDRDPDPAGFAGWVAALDGGTSRAVVVAGFSQSTEFTGRTATDFDAFMAGTAGSVLDGGAGDDVLIGGVLADQFIFAAGTGGRDRVLGLDAWDSLRFDGFGYASRADVQAHLTQVGDTAVFVDQGVQIVFEGLDVAQVREAEFLF
jgi:hypothetical protein